MYRNRSDFIRELAERINHQGQVPPEDLRIAEVERDLLFAYWDSQVIVGDWQDITGKIVSRLRDLEQIRAHSHKSFQEVDDE